MRLLIMSELEATWEALRSSSSTTRHAAAEAVEAATSAAASHLGTEHLHQDLGIDLHAAAHSTTSAKALHRVYEIFSAIVACAFPNTALAKSILPNV
jgi:hypothetical protein